MKAWRYLVGEASAAMNMAIDRAILQLAANGKSPPTLRLYTWNPPAVSLGYFQRKRGPNPEALRRFGFEVIRRPSGGRAVLHKGDVTYAVVAGLDDRMPYRADQAYRLISKGILLGLQRLGVPADSYDGAQETPMPAICFLRPASAEIVHQGKKFVGNAQTWLGHTLLQHGSIAVEPQADYLAELFRPERYPLAQFRQAIASKITSLREILGRSVGVAEVAEAVKEGMSEALGATFEQGELTREELALAEKLALQPEKELSHGSRRV